MWKHVIANSRYSTYKTVTRAVMLSKYFRWLFFSGFYYIGLKNLGVKHSVSAIYSYSSRVYLRLSEHWLQQEIEQIIIPLYAFSTSHCFSVRFQSAYTWINTSASVKPNNVTSLVCQTTFLHWDNYHYPPGLMFPLNC